MLTGKGIWTSAYKRFTHSTNIAGIGNFTRVTIPMSEDTTFTLGAPTTVQSANVIMGAGEASGGGLTTYRSWIKPDFSTIPAGKIFSTVSLFLTPTSDNSSNARTLSLHRCLRTLVVTQATWDIFSTGNNWGTAGASNATTDYEGAILLGSTSIPASPTLNVPIKISLNPQNIQKLYDGTYTNNGIVWFVDTQSSDLIRYASMDNPTTEYRPYIIIEYV